MPGGDPVAAAGDRAAEAADLVGHLAVGEVAHDLVDPLDGERVIGTSRGGGEWARRRVGCPLRAVPQARLALTTPKARSQAVYR